MSALSIFVPLTKVDVENRLVYGQVAAEVLDNSGEMFDYAKSKPYFQKWSSNAEITSGGLSKGNVRAMHGKVAAGKLTDLGFNDEDRTIECCAKVVDDNEWKKCLEGVYTGFSMGGRYAERWVEKSDNGMDIKRYAGDPAEISLVDKPCIPTATFQMIKADGVVEEAHFTSVLPEGQENQLMKVYVPTNDETLPVAQELAKAAGSPDWMDFMEAAREQLIKADAEKEKPKGEGEGDKGDFDEDAETGPKEGAESAVEADEDKAKEGSEAKDGAKDDKDGGKGKPPFGKDKEAAEKADAAGDFSDLEQVWRAKDGSLHLKKADAVALNEQLSKADAEPAAEPTLAEQVAELAKSAAAIAAGEAEPVAEVVEEAEPTEVVKYALFLEGGFALLKSADGGDELQKSMYTVERMARVLRDVASLQISVSKEQIREGDDSPTPGMIGVAVGQLGDTLIAMAKEEVDELMLQVAANDVKAEVLDYCCPDVYYELAASTLGLEKSAVNELGKAAQSKKLGQLQKMHDQCAKMGASCTGAEGLGKVDGGDELAKMAGEMSDLRKRAEDAEGQLVIIAPLIKSLQDDMERIKALPMPPAPRTSVVEKSDDGKGVIHTREAAAAPGSDLLTKFTPDQLADAAIRMAQGQGVTMTTRGSIQRG